MSLLANVARRLEAAGIDPDVRATALAALGAGAPPHGEPNEAPAAGQIAHLAGITVAGFRGVGERTTLPLDPRPGLTLVMGNNGSGKSSFAEAAEFALTGDNTRWAKRSKVWRDGWRNLHQPDPAEVTAHLVLDDGRELAVTRRWDPSSKLEDHTLEVSDGTGLDERGWSAALELYRPFLPYGELGALVDDGPTALHDTLSAVLGLDLLTDGAKRLRTDRLDRQRRHREALEAAASLAEEVRAVDDPRAQQVADLLAAKDPDPAMIATHVTDDRDELDPASDVLRVLAGLPGPDLDGVRRAAAALDTAVERVRDARDSDAARDLDVADLLAAARRFHDHHGDGDCAVCGTGVMDATWAQRAEGLERQLRDDAGSMQDATEGLLVARRALASVATEPPVSLHRAGMADLDAALALATWERLAATRDIEDDGERAVQVRQAAEAVAEALVDLRARAKAALAVRRNDWAPVARRVTEWVELARQARDDDASSGQIKAAEDALQQVMDEIRAERWTPIADQARAIWELLGQGSSVAIEQVALAGTGTRRRVEVSVTVDGIEGAALGVMSQGELHALALALFLPRAGLAESPFGFLVIDDPVQSMDSIRVEGLARVLEQVATRRQVVVFTHDDRLRAAVRRLGMPTTVLEVHRGRGSSVEVRDVSSS